MTNGYAGGSASSADYETVSSGSTDHAEAVEVRFDPTKITFGQILKVFFSIAHDPTTRDRQGPDVGRQYRSVIFHSDDEQQRVAEAYIKQLDAAKVFDRPIVTEVVPLDRFYKAEDYHQDYAARNPLQPYILFTARPKVDKVRKYYKDRLESRSGSGRYGAVAICWIREQHRRGLTVERSGIDEPARRDERLRRASSLSPAPDAVDRLLHFRARPIADRGERGRRENLDLRAFRRGRRIHPLRPRRRRARR